MASKSSQDGGGNTVYPAASYMRRWIHLRRFSDLMKNCTVLQGLDKVWTSAFEQEIDPMEPS
jgi:hypothetical protein